MAIQKVRQEDGTFVEVPALKGSDANVTAETIQKALGKSLVLESSTEGNTKKFAITVGDDGTLTVTEATE